MEAEIIIKRAQAPEDYEVVRQIRHEVFTEEQGVPVDIEVDLYEEESVFFLAYLNGEPASTGRFRIKDSLIKFERVATLSHVRGKGSGRKLMRYMERMCHDQYPQHLQVLHAQVDSASFYRELGWETVGEPFVEADILHRLMVKLPGNSSKLGHMLCLSDPDTLPILNDFLRALI